MRGTRRLSFRRRGLAALAVLVLLAPASGAMARVVQDQPPPQGEWQRVTPESAAVEQLPAAPFVLYAYGFVWVATLGYLWTIWRRVGRLRQDLDHLERRLAGSQR